MNRNRIMNLQRFANPNTQTTGSAGLAVEMKEYYDKRLISLAEPNLVHDQFAQKRNIPRNGGKTIEFRKYDSLPKALTPLTEGVTPDGGTLNVTKINATISQYGYYITLSDLLQMTAIDNNVVQALKQLGGQAGRTSDSITRDVLAGGTNVIYPNDKLQRKALASTDTLNMDLVFQAAAQLDAMNAKTIEGSYVGIIHPYVAYDLMSSPEWIDVHKYATPDNIFKGEIGMIAGVRFVKSSEAKVWNDDTCPEDSASSTGHDAVFSTLILGADAYATTAVDGGGIETIVKQLGEGDDPLNQRSTVGWKMNKVSERLVEQYMVRIESISARYSKKTAAN